MSRRHIRTAGLVVALVVAGTACGDGSGDEAEPTLGQPVGASQTPIESADPATVAGEIDGDSLELEIGGDVVEVRLLGINAPELADCTGPAARDELAAILDLGPIGVIEDSTDRYGRVLVELTAGEVDVNAEMVRRGWALALHGSGDRLLGLAADAAAAGIGLWDPDAAGCSPRSERLRVVGVTADPPGPDEDHLEDELVVVANDGDTAAQLGEWILRDESTGNRFVFPVFELEPGASVRVRTGCGQDSRTDLFWCSPGPVWSNGGDTALLLGPDGVYVSHLVVD